MVRAPGKAIQLAEQGISTMKMHWWTCTLVVELWLMTRVANAEPAAEGEIRGLLWMRSKVAPAPAGSQQIPLPGGDFETGGNPPPGWVIERDRRRDVGRL
jgi:hypothetical protein